MQSMVVIEHRQIEIVLCLVAVLSGSIWIFRVFKGRRTAVRLPLQAGASLFAFSSAVLLFAVGCVELTTSEECSDPIYSPDRTHAVVVRSWDAGPIGGNATYLDLYSYGGVREEDIGGGDFESIVASDIKWKSNEELTITYDGSYGIKPICESTATIRVTCAPRSDRSH
jgi:hypothetical protein